MVSLVLGSVAAVMSAIAALYCQWRGRQCDRERYVLEQQRIDLLRHIFDETKSVEVAQHVAA